MSELPSREDREGWIGALSVASQNTTLDLSTAGVLDHIRHLIVTGQLIDREAIDWEAGGDWWIDECRMLGYSTDRWTGRRKAQQFAAALGIGGD